MNITARISWIQHNNKNRRKGEAKGKPSYSPEGNEYKVSTEKMKGQASNHNMYRGKNTHTKTQCPDLKDDA